MLYQAGFRSPRWRHTYALDISWVVASVCGRSSGRRTFGERGSPDTLKAWLGCGGAATTEYGSPTATRLRAKEAELRKPPSRFGTWVLRRLGHRGEIGERAPRTQTRSSHERPVHGPPGH